MARKNRRENPEEFQPGERVVANADMREVPAGTNGVVTTVSGLSWIRYWVRFDNGVQAGSINRAKLATEGTWDPETAARQAADAEQRAAEGAAAAEHADGGDKAPGGDAAPASNVPASKVPAHLLERAKKARAKAAG
ncbi:hypothetical protein BH24ACT3_BH24ACT3_05530 [soil metagenome]